MCQKSHSDRSYRFSEVRPYAPPEYQSVESRPKWWQRLFQRKVAEESEVVEAELCEDEEVFEKASGFWLCGFDFSSSMRSHASIFPYAWNEKLRIPMQKCFPNIRVQCFSVNSTVKVMSNDFQSINSLPEIYEEDICVERLLGSGSYFCHFLEKATERAMRYCNGNEPVVISLLCDGYPTDLRTDLAVRAKELVCIGRSMGIRYKISCFIPGSFKYVEKMRRFQEFFGFSQDGERGDVEFMMVHPPHHGGEDQSSMDAASDLFSELHAVFGQKK